MNIILRKNEDNTRIYKLNIILVISIVFSALAIILGFLQDVLIARIIIVLILTVIGFVYRKTIYTNMQQLLKK